MNFYAFISPFLIFRSGTTRTVEPLLKIRNGEMNA